MTVVSPPSALYRPCERVAWCWLNRYPGEHRPNRRLITLRRDVDTIGDHASVVVEHVPPCAPDWGGALGPARVSEADVANNQQM
jgi:hypothetical protein